MVDILETNVVLVEVWEMVSHILETATVIEDVEDDLNIALLKLRQEKPFKVVQFAKYLIDHHLIHFKLELIDKKQIINFNILL